MVFRIRIVFMIFIYRLCAWLCVSSKGSLRLYPFEGLLVPGGATARAQRPNAAHEIPSRLASS